MLGDFMLGFTKRAEGSNEERQKRQQIITKGLLLHSLLTGSFPSGGTALGDVMLGYPKRVSFGNKLAKSSAPPMLARTISKAGPRADDLTAESDRAKFEVARG